MRYAELFESNQPGSLSDVFEDMATVYIEPHQILSALQKLFAAKYPGVHVYHVNGSYTTDQSGDTNYWTDSDEATTGEFAVDLEAYYSYSAEDAPDTIEIAVAVSTAMAGKYKGVVGAWIAGLFNSIEDEVKKEIANAHVNVAPMFDRKLIIDDDRSYGAWEAIAEKCNAELIG